MLSVIPLSRGVGGPLVIQSEQLKAAIEVGRYATQCVETLLEERLAKLSPWMEQEQLLERKILKYVKEHPDTPKRPMQQRLSKYCTAKQFNAVIASMVEAGRLNQNEETLKLSLGKR
jgi:hypothetical protein